MTTCPNRRGTGAASRHRILKAATIEFGDGSIICLVRNISDREAMLDIARPVDIPEHISLAIPTEGKHLPCRVVWRKAKRLGVLFE